jgi:uncharacterized phage protein (predicted DNA packaging)
MYLSVDELKRFCNVPFTDDDLLFMELIEAAESAVEHYIGQPISTFVDENSSELDPALKTAIKYLASNFYMNREPIAYANPYKVCHTYDYLLQPFKKYVKD